jgi:nitrogen fixation protein NifM
MNAYLELKLSWELYQRPPQGLAAAESAALDAAAVRQRLLESRILAAPEAAQALVTPAAVAQRRAEIRARYADEESFRADLAGIGLDTLGLEAEIARDLRIEGVLERVASAVAPATDVDAEIFYRVHADRFVRPERRELRHILVTCADAAEKRAALDLLVRLRATCVGAKAFAAAAMKHSHCPTALEGGRLGTMARGKLYPALDAAAFALAAGALSAPVETEVGLHLLRCDAIHPAATPDFAAVRERILAGLDASRRKAAQKNWIKSLQKS